MKFNKSFLLALSSIAILAGCAPVSNPTSEEAIQNKASEQQIVLNLTDVGLYKGAKGTANPSLFLENTVTLSLEVGAKLPDSSDVTSTSTDVVFKTWVYYDKGGILSSTDKVVDNVFEYQAHFEYTGEFQGGNTDPDDPGSSGTTSKIYFITQSWWDKDGATTSMYYWGSNKDPNWPGYVMHLEETLSDSRKVWSYEIDVSGLQGFIFARTSSGATEGSSGTDWGAKTKDLTPSALGSNNCVILTNTTETWGAPGCDVKYSTYVPGKINY